MFAREGGSVGLSYLPFVDTKIIHNSLIYKSLTFQTVLFSAYAQITSTHNAFTSRTDHAKNFQAFFVRFLLSLHYRAPARAEILTFTFNIVKLLCSSVKEFRSCRPSTALTRKMCYSQCLQPPEHPPPNLSRSSSDRPPQPTTQYQPEQANTSDNAPACANSSTN